MLPVVARQSHSHLHVHLSPIVDNHVNQYADAICAGSNLTADVAIKPRIFAVQLEILDTLREHKHILCKF